MKKVIIYLILFVIFGSVTAFVILINKKKEEAFLPMKPRTGIQSNSEEYKLAKKSADELFERIKKNPADNKSKLQLTSLYIQEARITGDHAYYDAAAMKLTEEVLKTDSTNFEANVFKGTIYLSQHHFTEAREVATRIQQLNPHNAFVYGMLVDANVELGNYEAAVAACDQMISIRPDIRSYSRVSYLREIYGDNAGAIDAMRMAVSAGYPGEEGTEWARVHLGQLYENVGDLQNAKLQYAIALEERTDYAYAYAGLGRIARANKNYTEAISYFLKADAVVNDYSIKDQLTDLYLLAGENDKSTATAAQVIEMLSSKEKDGKEENSHGHYADRELAYAYLKTGDFDKALNHALTEYNRRPVNIEVNEMLAWVYFKQNDFAHAREYMSLALKTNSKNPTRLCRAGLIYARSGDVAKAMELIKSTLEKNPNISEELKAEAARIVPVV